MAEHSFETLALRASTDAHLADGRAHAWAMENLTLNWFKHESVAMWGFTLTCRETPSITLVLDFADAVFSARAALDHLAWDLFLRCGGDPDSSLAKSCYFPIARDPGDFVRLAHKYFPGATPGRLELLESVQDYRTGQTDLADLHKLSIDIRHRALSVLAAPAKTTRIQTPEIPPGFDLRFYSDPGRSIQMGTNLFAWLSWNREDGADVDWADAPPLVDQFGLEYTLALIGTTRQMRLPDFIELTDKIFDLTRSYAFLSIVGPMVG